MTGKPLLFVAALALSACASQPQTSAPSPGARGATTTLQDLNGSRIAMPVGLFLASMDTDRDTRVSFEEMQDGVEQSFEAGDTDANGYLTPIEFEDWARTFLGTEHTIPGRFHFDHDQDASVSLSEFTATFEEIHHRLDTNQDGALVRAELLVEVNGLGIDPAAMRAQMEAEMRRNMEGKIREICRGRR